MVPRQREYPDVPEQPDEIARDAASCLAAGASSLHLHARDPEVDPPFVFNLLPGSLGTMSATTENLAMLVRQLPADSYWQAAGIGRAQWPMNALGVVMGGSVRTGLEDNLHMDREKREPASNPHLVRRVARLGAALGRKLASPADARQLMGLPLRVPSLL
jgi:3-keto-5-aminohexanoate cleavage enzyme